MTIEMMKKMVSSLYVAKRVMELFPDLPDGINEMQYYDNLKNMLNDVADDEMEQWINITCRLYESLRKKSVSM